MKDDAINFHVTVRDTNLKNITLNATNTATAT